MELALVVFGLIAMQRWAVLLLFSDLLFLAPRIMTTGQGYERLAQYAVFAILLLPYWNRMRWTLQRRATTDPSVFE
jgi:hypothetical protein